MSQSHLDPSSVAPETLRELSKVLALPGHVALIDDEGHRVDLPEPLFAHLGRIVRLLMEGRPFSLMPKDEECTTQAAADFLGVSRQHLVNLLEEGKIPFRKVGTHRRVVLRDLVAFQKERDQGRREALKRLSKDVDEAGLYDASYTGEE